MACGPEPEDCLLCTPGSLPHSRSVRLPAVPAATATQSRAEQPPQTVWPAEPKLFTIPFFTELGCSILFLFLKVLFVYF